MHVKFLLMYNGRDKFSKLIQYGSRFGYYHYLKDDPKNETGLVLKSFYSAASDARKFFRLGRWLYEYQTMYVALKNPKLSGGALALILVAKMSWFWYWWFDNLNYLKQLNLINVTKETNDKFAMESARGWTYGCFFECAQVLVNWTALEAARPSMNPVEYKAQRNVMIEDLIKQGSDFLTAIHYFKVYLWRDDWLGFWGSLNSYMSVIQYWRKC